MEWLFNPWVICVIIVAVVASNILALKYTAYMRTGLKKDASNSHHVMSLYHQKALTITIR